MVARPSQIRQLAGGREQGWCLHLCQWKFIQMDRLSRENACYIKHLTSAAFQAPAKFCPVPGVLIPYEVCCCQHSDSILQVEGKIVMISASDSHFGWVKLCCHALNPLLITGCSCVLLEPALIVLVAVSWRILISPAEYVGIRQCLFKQFVSPWEHSWFFLQKPPEPIRIVVHAGTKALLVYIQQWL